MPRVSRWVSQLGVAVAALLSLQPGVARATLVAHWSFDETSGTTAFPSTGSVSGNLSGGASFVPGGISGNALSVPGSGFASFGNNFPFTSGSFSVVAWINIAPGSTTGMIPVSKHLNGSNNGYFLALNDVGDGLGAAAVNKAHFYDSGANSGASTTVINDGAWHLLVGVYDTASNLAKIYVDTGPAESQAARTGIANNTVPFVVGGTAPGGSPANAYNGLIDEVALFDHALNDSEIAAIFDNPALPEPSAAVLLAGALGVVAHRRRCEKKSVSDQG